MKPFIPLMKKKVLVLLLAFVMLIVLGLVFKEFISASIFDTFAVTQDTTPTVTLDAYPPDLIVDSPTSTNYSTRIVDINYSVSDSGSGVDAVWYNLDGGQNTTLTGNTTVTVSQRGDYNFYIYANDSVGFINDTEFVTFSVNATRTIEVNFSRFDVPTTTNFSDLNDTELEDVTGLTLEITSYGKINFSENINISEDTSLDNNIDISQNSIYINSNALPNFNKPATLQIYGLTFTNPRILRDGSVCPASICTKTNYSGGILEFTVTGFTNYSSEETPTEGVSPGAPGGAGGAGGGGAGGMAVKEVSSFDVDKSLIKVSLKQGETKRESLSIKNTGGTSLDVSLDLQNLQEFVIFPGGISTYNLKLGPGEEQTIQLIFNVAKDKEPGVYPGRIIVKADSLQKLITTIVEVESEKAVFDVEAKILPEHRQVFPGESVSAEIKIFNLLGRGRVDVAVEYGIQDLEGNVILSGSSVVAVETQMSFVKSLIIPFNMEPGTYVFYVKAKYDSTTSTSSDTFEVVKAPGPVFVGLSVIQLIIIAVTGLILLFIVLALRDILVHLRKERELLREEKEAPPQIIVLRGEGEKELKKEEPKEILGKPEEKPKKVEEVVKKKEVKKPEEKKKRIRLDLVEHIRKIRERMRGE